MSCERSISTGWTFVTPFRLARMCPRWIPKTRRPAGSCNSYSSEQRHEDLIGFRETVTPFQVVRDALIFRVAGLIGSPGAQGSRSVHFDQADG